MSSKTIVLNNIHTLVPMTADRNLKSDYSVIHDATVIVNDNVIAWVGPSLDTPEIIGPFDTINEG